ncbi:MAG: DUF2946 family protein [Burkholderiaceae bacterium]
MPRASFRTVLAWITAFSLLLSGMPSLARALPSMPEMAICSTGAASADGKTPQAMAAHCLVCCSAGQPSALPAAALPAPLRLTAVRAGTPSAPPPIAATSLFHQPLPRAPPRA